jgi:GT2 family glycosyltransferase
MAGACVMRRSAFVGAGGYERKFFLGGEETLLSYDIQRLGWRLAYIPAMVLHHHPSLLRDSVQRRKLLLRNALWCAWLRRPWLSVIRETTRQLALVFREPRLMQAVLDACGEAAWAWRRREVLPQEIEARLRCVEKNAGLMKEEARHAEP